MNYKRDFGLKFNKIQPHSNNELTCLRNVLHHQFPFDKNFLVKKSNFYLFSNQLSLLGRQHQNPGLDSSKNVIFNKWPYLSFKETHHAYMGLVELSTNSTFLTIRRTFPSTFLRTRTNVWMYVWKCFLFTQLDKHFCFYFVLLSTLIVHLAKYNMRKCLLFVQLFRGPKIRK